MKERKNWEILVAQPDLKKVRERAEKFTKRELADMMMWRDPNALYWKMFSTLRKVEAVDDVVKEVKYIWSLVEQGYDW